MKYLQLVLLFVGIVAIFILALNWNVVFGGGNDDISKEDIVQIENDNKRKVEEKTVSEKKMSARHDVETPETDDKSGKKMPVRDENQLNEEIPPKDDKAKETEKALETPSVNIDQVRQKIVDLIRSGKTLSDIQKVAGYNSLDMSDKITVEAILRPEQLTNPGTKSHYRKPDKIGQMQIEKAVQRKTTIKTWADLKAIQNEMTRIMNKYKKSDYENI